MFADLLDRHRVVFVTQFYGAKEVMNEVNDFKWFMDNVSSVFRVDDVCDSEDKIFEGTKFCQDIALSIR